MNAQQEQRAAPPPRDRPSWKSFSGLRSEWPLVASFTTAALFLVFGPHWLADLSNPFWLTFLVAWLFAVILLSAFAMVRHGESLAIKLGEPRGTLIMTLAATGIEVMMISAFMFNRHEDSSPFARDALFAVVMIVLNGLVGLSLLGRRASLPRADVQPPGGEYVPRRDCAPVGTRHGPAELHGLCFGADVLGPSSHLLHRHVGRAVWRVPRRPDLESPGLFHRTRRCRRFARRRRPWARERRSWVGCVSRPAAVALPFAHGRSLQAVRGPGRPRHRCVACAASARRAARVG